jgi:hypothetical protein
MIPYLIAGLGIAKGLAETFFAYSSARREYKQNLRRWQDEALERKEAYTHEAAQFDFRSEEIENLAQSEALERRLELKREEARLAVATGEAGVAGNTVDRLFVGVAQKAGRDVGTIDYNRFIAQRQNYTQLLTAWRRGRPPKFYGEAPDPRTYAAAGALGVLSGGLDGYLAAKKV